MGLSIKNILRAFGGSGDDAGRVPSRAPVTAFEKARIVWFERYGSVMVERNKAYVLLVMTVGAIGLLAFAINRILPLKEVRPYMVETNKVTGEVYASPNQVRKYIASDNEKKARMARFVELLFTLDKYRTKQNLIDSYTWIAGTKAKAQFQSFIDEQKPFDRLIAEKELTREVKVISTNFLADGAGIVRFTTTERSENIPQPLVKVYVMTLHYAIEDPKTEEEIYKNPLGLFFTYFAITQEVQ